MAHGSFDAVNVAIILFAATTNALDHSERCLQPRLALRLGEGDACNAGRSWRTSLEQQYGLGCPRRTHTHTPSYSSLSSIPFFILSVPQLIRLVQNSSSKLTGEGNPQTEALRQQAGRPNTWSVQGRKRKVPVPREKVAAPLSRSCYSPIWASNPGPADFYLRVGCSSKRSSSGAVLERFVEGKGHVGDITDTLAKKSIT